jgi:glycosyltransferase involved in cell wall biosynthesis
LELAINGIRLMGRRFGVGRYVEYLLRHWRGVRHPFDRIAVYTPGPLDEPIELPERAEHRILRSRHSNAWWEQVVLGRARRVHDVLLCPSYVATFPGRGKTVVTHLGSYEALPSAFPPLERWKTRLLYQLSAHRADRVIAVSESVKSDIVRFYRIRPEKVTVIPLGVDSTFHPIADPQKLAATRERTLGADRPFVLFVGKLSRRRNLPELVQAFGRLKRRRGLPHALVLVGSNPLGYDLAALARRADLGSSLVHLEYASHQELVSLYNAADLFVYPSSYEGFGIPVLEAMACGTPTVALDNSAFPEFAAGVAHLAPGASEEELDRAMEKMLFSPELRARAREAGPERARQFSWDSIARRTMQLLFAVATGKDPGAA